MASQFVGARSVAALILASACWGVATVICKGLLSSVSPSTLLVIQLSPSVVLLWMLTLLRRRPIPGRRALLPLGSLGILNPGISYTASP